MTIAYEVFTKISMVNGVSSVLAVIGKEVLQLEGGVKRLQAAFTSLNRTSLAIGGGLAIVGGMAGLGAVKTMVDHAKELTHQLTAIKKLGVSGGDFEKYRAAAFAAHSQVAGTTSVDALKILNTTNSMFGVEGSVKILKPLLQFQQVMGNTMGDYEKAAEQMREMIRGGELSGQFMDEATHKVDTNKLTHFLELGTKVAGATHGMVDPHAWLMLAQQAGPMLGTMDDEGMLTMAMITQAMKGSRAGTALQAVGRQFLGLKMTTPTSDALDSLGFFKREMYTDKAGRIRNKYVTNHGADPWSATGKAFVEGLQSDPMKAAPVLLKALNEHGYKTMKQIVPMLYQIFGTDTARRLMHEMVRNMPQMIDENGRIKQGLGFDEALKAQNQEDYEQVEHNFLAAKNELLMHIGLPMMQYAIPVMQKLTATLDGFTEWAKKNPDTVANIGKWVAILSASLVGAGATAIALAIGPAGWLTAGIIALGGAVAGLGGFTGAIKSFIAAVSSTHPNVHTETGQAPAPKMEKPETIWSVVSGAFTEIGKLGSQIFKTMKDVWNSQIKSIADWLHSVLEGEGGIFGAIKRGLAPALEVIKSGAESLRSTIMTVFGPAIDFANGLFSKVAATLRGVVASAISYATGLFDTFSAAIRSVGEAISSAISSIKSAISGLFSGASFQGGGMGGGGAIQASYHPDGPVNGTESSQIVSVGRALQAQGLRVSEHPAFGGVAPVHHGRGHYEGRAIDVNVPGVGVEASNPSAAARFDSLARKLRSDGLRVIWRAPGHFNHMHVEVPRGGHIHTGLFGNLGHKPELVNINYRPRDDFKKIQPPKKQQDQGPEIITVLKVDGREFGRAASRLAARHHEHSTQMAYFNGPGMHVGPDTHFAVG